VLAAGLQPAGAKEIAMGTKTTLRKDIDDALLELEKLADEVRVKIHLANMDARDAWQRLEPKLEDAKAHGREATKASKAAINDAVEAVRSLAREL
jgi:hypothetical protein